MSTNKQKDMKNLAQTTYDQAQKNIQMLELQIKQCREEVSKNSTSSDGFWQNEIKELKKAAYENLEIAEAMQAIMKKQTKHTGASTMLLLD